MAEKKYKGRRAYLNDFKKNESGNYEYQGTMYHWTEKEDDLRKKLRSLWFLFSGMMIALIFTGCMDVPGLMNSFSVIFPFAVSFVFGISVGWALWRLSTSGESLRSYVYEASVEKLPFRCGGVLVCTIAAILGEIIYVFKHGFGDHFGKILLFFLIEGLILAFSYMFLQRIRQMCWEKQTEN